MVRAQDGCGARDVVRAPAGADRPQLVVLKVQVRNEDDDGAHCFGLDEEEMQVRVNDACPGLAPTLLGGVTVTGATSDVRLTFMQYIDGCTMLTDCVVDPPLVAAVAQAVSEMWLRSGVAHLDMHGNNVLVHQATGHVHIVDFGMAMPIGDLVRARLGERMVCRMRGASAARLARKYADAFDDECMCDARRVLESRGYKKFNSDSVMLKALARCVQA
jgi:hypothetical protein